jgi:hypothetical protein
MISFGDGDKGLLASEKISLVKAGGVWKIDDVKGIYPKASEFAGMIEPRKILKTICVIQFSELTLSNLRPHLLSLKNKANA